MASSGCSGRSASGVRSFDFGSDDVLCSYDDYTPQMDQTANGKRSDSSTKDLHENRVGRPLANVYEQPEEFSREDVIYAVEKCMKKYADNLMRHLEGISGRLTQLELYCYKLDRSIGEFRADMIREQNDADLKLKSLEKHVHEVHRFVQIIRDKQELSETQKELAKIQISQKEPTNSSHSQKSSEGVLAASPESKAHNDSSDASNQQLALALPHQITPSPSLAIRAPGQNQPYKEPAVQQQPAPLSLNVSTQDGYALNQAISYYTQHQPPLPPEHQSQTQQPELHYAQQRTQMHNISVQAPPNQQQTNVAANQLTQQQPFPQYPQQWSQQMQPQQPSSQAQAPRPQNPHAYAAHAPNQPANTIQPEAYLVSSMPLPAPYSTAPQSGGYGGSGSSISHLPPQHNMQRQPLPQASQGSFGPQPLAKGGYVGPSTYTSQPNMQDYNALYIMDGSRASQFQNFQPGRYPPNGNVAAPHSFSNHPYGEMIEKAVSMGYPRDQVVRVVHEIGESGHPLDLNALLDKLETLTSTGPRRTWSS